MPPLSDHDVVYAELNIAPPITLYNKADWDNMKEVDEMKDTATASTEDLWTLLLEASQTHIPSKKSRPNYSQPWIPPSFVAVTEPTKSGRREAVKISKLRQEPGDAKPNDACAEHIDTTLSEEPTEHTPKYKRFWSYIKNQKSANVGVAPLKMNGQLLMEPREKADALNKQFQSAFSEGKTYTEEEFQEKYDMDDGDYPLLDSITVEGVNQLLMKLDPAKASGPDNISARLLKELSSEIAPILTTIYRPSLNSGCVPTDWKDALVSPIFKKR
ncbi:hypothetical protein ACOMHN_058232 [Nucella lapillus]